MPQSEWQAGRPRVVEPSLGGCCHSIPYQYLLSCALLKAA